MTLKRQLLLVSLLALLLPWAGCEFIRETESALRQGQQELLAGTAKALANALARYDTEYPRYGRDGLPGERHFAHALTKPPAIDGYFDDWLLSERSLQSLRGTDGPVQIAMASHGRMIYLFVDVRDNAVVYATDQSMVTNSGPHYADRVALISSNPPYLEEQFIFTAEAPGSIVGYKVGGSGTLPIHEPAITAHWQDVPGGYQLEARIPAALIGTNVGVIVSNTSDKAYRPTRISSYSGQSPEPMVTASVPLQNIAQSLLQPGTRLLITDNAGWRLAVAGELSESTTQELSDNGWSRHIYDLLVKDGRDAGSAEPDPSGREQLPYVGAALNGTEMASWFRREDSGRAIVAVATPIVAGDENLGALVLQQGTDAILSATNDSLARLINITLVATLLVAGVLIAYATWLSRRIRHLSVAAEDALENEALHSALPSALAADEIGDLSRSFSYVLRQLGDYNSYLRTLASKLSHELRTPLAIVTSSLENLEHESLSVAGSGYTTRAREGAERLRRILGAMSEASRVEELMAHAEPEEFDLQVVLQSAVASYRDVYRERFFELSSTVDIATMNGSPELLIQLLDKLINNAVDFSTDGDTIAVDLDTADEFFALAVSNPGRPLPKNMRSQLFDSMVSVRRGEHSHHLGLGLYVAKLIAEGHGGSIAAADIEGGVRFTVRLSAQDSR